MSSIWPFLKNEWVEMDDPAPPRRRTHGGTGGGGAGPCQALAAEGGGRKARLYKGPSIPGYNRHRRTDGLQFKAMR